jgi:flagellar transcriptional activator FlhD
MNLTRAAAGDAAYASGQGITSEIHDVNLAYLLLVQRLVRDDSATAMIRLGLSREMAELLGNLSVSQVVKLAASSFLLCRFRLGDHPTLTALTQEKKEWNLKQAHASILLSGQQVEAAF